jgi:hypothetical protein
MFGLDYGIVRRAIAKARNNRKVGAYNLRYFVAADLTTWLLILNCLIF